MNKKCPKRRREMVANLNLLNFSIIFQSVLTLRSRKFLPPYLPSPGLPSTGPPGLDNSLLLGCFAYHRKFSSILGLYALDGVTHLTPYLPSVCNNQKCLQTLANASWGAKSLPVKNRWSRIFLIVLAFMLSCASPYFLQNRNLTSI